MVLDLGLIKLANPGGLWALLALVPLLILYLIRPRPKEVKIPSLMFFMKSKGSRKLTSFLKVITRDWLFVIQFLIILALALTFSDPFTSYTQNVTSQNTVIVLDVSASSLTMEGGRTRFDLGVREAKKKLGAENTLILAKDVPLIALQDVDADDVENYLNSLRPKTTTSQIGEAVILAGEVLDKEGRVVVISDFINTGGQDPYIAKSVLETKGLQVEFVNTASPGKSNIGIVDLAPGTEETTVYVKNYDNTGYEIPLKIGQTTTSIDVPAKGIESYSFKTPKGVTEIELTLQDDLIADNTAYLSAPTEGKAKILLITNNQSEFLVNALLASGEVELEIAEPPIVPDGDYDIYVIHDVDINQVLPGTFEDIVKKEKKAVIVHVQYNSNNINYKGLLPVKLGDPQEGGIISIDQMNAYTKNTEFGMADAYFDAELDNGAISIASVNEQPVIAMKQEKAKLVYFGIPETSEFKFSTSYPIFWTELIKQLTSQQDVRNLNFKAGDTIILDEEQTVKTPTKTVKKAALILDESGVYELEDRTIAVNLVNEKESDVNAEEIEGIKSPDYELQSVKQQKEWPFTVPLLIAAMIILFLELLFIKRRGVV